MALHPHRLSVSHTLGVQPVFLTFCTHHRAPLFTSPDMVGVVEQHFRQSCTSQDFEILAFCFMPDHLHALVSGRSSQANFARLVRVSKQQTAFHVRRRFAMRLWQDSFFDRTVRGDEDALDVIRYIINNPVRAGLVVSPSDYPFWGSDMYAREEILNSL